MKIFYKRLHARKIHKPFNFAFKTMYNSFGKELHENLKIPGIFHEKEK